MHLVNSFCLLCVAFRFLCYSSYSYPQKTYISRVPIYVPSSELGLSHPFSRQRVCHYPRAKGAGEHTRLRVRGWRSPNSDDWRKSLVLCLLCALISLSVLHVYVSPSHSVSFSAASVSSFVVFLPLLTPLSSAQLFLRHYRKLAQSCGCHAKLFPALIRGPAQRRREKPDMVFLNF